MVPKEAKDLPNENKKQVLLYLHAPVELPFPPPLPLCMWTCTCIVRVPLIGILLVTPDKRLNEL
jgi:hypothetical protein